MNPSAAPPDRPQVRLPPPSRAALLLDMDGTLIDIAPKPDLVVVPPGLTAALTRLRDRLSGALAVVSGRPVEQVDALLGGAPYAVAGEHGGAIRHAPGAALVRPALPEPPAAWLETAERLAARHSGAFVERKQRGFVVHYRLAPEAAETLREALSEMIGDRADRFHLLASSMAWEVRPRGADKGTAVAALMAMPPFAGRLPVFIGDDVTDEDGMHAARTMGGEGFRVPDVFGDAASVRAWLAGLVEEGEWPGW